MALGERQAILNKINARIKNKTEVSTLPSVEADIPGILIDDPDSLGGEVKPGQSFPSFPTNFNIKPDIDWRTY